MSIMLSWIFNYSFSFPFFSSSPSFSIQNGSENFLLPRGKFDIRNCFRAQFVNSSFVPFIPFHITRSTSRERLTGRTYDPVFSNFEMARFLQSRLDYSAVESRVLIPSENSARYRRASSHTNRTYVYVYMHTYNILPISATRRPHGGQSGRDSPPLPPHSRSYENTISENRVLIFSRLPRLDLASDSTPATAVSTFPKSRVVGGRNVGFGKGNVRRVCTPPHCAHRPHSRVPLLAGFLLAGASLAQLHKHTHPRHCPSRIPARARASASACHQKRSKTKHLRARLRSIN